MKIGFDVRPALRLSTGVGRYVMGLVRALVELEKPPEVVVFSSSLRDAFEPGRWPPAVRLCQRRVPARLIEGSWRWLRWPRFEWLAARVDLVHSPGPIRIPTARPQLVTLHDLFFLKYPDLVEYSHGRSYTRIVARELRAAQAVVAVSQYTRSQALGLLGLAEDRIHVVHSGIGMRWFQPLDEYQRRSRLGRMSLDGDFVLAVGRPEPRKNIGVAVRALARLRRRHVYLVIAGPPGPDSNSLAREASRVGVTLRVVGHVPDDDLKALYQSARALVFPSLDEGFGFPLLEAMALGLPVVATEAGAIPEVTGDAAALAPLGDEDAFAHCLAEVLESPERSALLTKRGQARARDFSWERTARATLELYAKVLAQ